MAILSSWLLILMATIYELADLLNCTDMVKQADKAVHKPISGGFNSFH